jgi:hypothetical protein
MSNRFTQDFRTQRRNTTDGTTRIGDPDRLWYDSETRTIRLSDGITPGGIIIAGADFLGGGSGSSTIGNIDGGNATSVYTYSQVISGGSA